ncbi:segregation/condensation protein A [Candidatus Bipolaricaulota bacterium]|nr:segregation/condensation protein A [Candidatus Bipolaricaulota bacterium]
MDVAVQIAEVPIEDLLEESWEGALERLTVDMDPWDIDIGELARRYRHYIETLRELHFAISGQMVLTCSILLRMQSDDLLAAARPTERSDLLDELEEAVAEEAAVWEEPLAPNEFALPIMRRPQRQVTLRDLRRAFAAAMKVSSRRAVRHLQQAEADDEDDDNVFDQFQLGGETFGDRLHCLFNKIKQLLTGRRMTSFFRLLDRGDKEERVRYFFEILHLEAQGEITCSQEEFLGDITITLPLPLPQDG